MSQRVYTISGGASQYLASVFEQARHAAALADGAYTGLIRQLGIEGPATLVSLAATSITVDVTDAEAPHAADV